MSLAEDLQRKSNEATTVKRCKLGELIESLDPETGDALTLYIEKARADKALPVHERVFTAAWLEQTLRTWKHNIGRTVLSEHINERCSCDVGK